MSKQKNSKRLFLALWPDEFTRKRLSLTQQKLSRSSRLTSASAVAPENFHITLHFLGAVDEDVYTKLVECLANVNVGTFSLEINRWDYLPKPRILFLGAQDIPDALTDLVKNTKACINEYIEGYQQKQFLAHLTLFRKSRHPKRLDEFDSINWKVDRFVLMESITWQEGVEYRVLQEWRLAA